MKEKLELGKDYIVVMNLQSIPDDWEIDKWIEHIQGKGIVFWNSHNPGNQGKMIMTEPKVIYLNK